MITYAVLTFLGVANLAYILLSRRLLKGLSNLALPRPKSQAKPTVTVLIAARNEEGRLGPCLEGLLQQDYPREKLQIVVVDDRSEDGTAALLEGFRLRAPDLVTAVKITEITPGLSPKKHALTRGMQVAHGEIIITTDADCLMGPAWVSSLVSEFDERTGLVLGMTSYYDPPSSSPVLAGTQALEFISYGIVAAALVGLRFPVHGNANNIAYRRKVYDLASGFESHGRIISGDDDFLIQGIHALATWEIRYAVSPESQVRTEPPLSLRQFWEQRKRWASKCGFYQPKQAAFLSAIFLYYALILVFTAAGAVIPALRPWLLVGLGSFGVKTGMDWWVMKEGLRVFGKRELLRHFAPTAILHIPLIIAAVVAGTIFGFTWKGQAHRRKA